LWKWRRMDRAGGGAGGEGSLPKELKWATLFTPSDTFS
jgi:hypothetical protein